MEKEVREQLTRAAFSGVALNIRFIPYSGLDHNQEAIRRFGQGMKPIEAISKTLP